MKGHTPRRLLILLNDLPSYGVDVGPDELIKLVRVRQFPDPISLDPLAWDEEEILAYLHPDLSICWHRLVDDDGPIEF